MKKLITLLVILLLASQLTKSQCWQSIAIGGYHTIGIKSDGSLWAWGWNVSGQLGIGTKQDKITPTQVGIEKEWKSISLGSVHTLALKSNGSLWAWGNNLYGQLGNGSTTDKLFPTWIGMGTFWQSVSAGREYSLGIESNGTLWAWGWNGSGQLGDGTQNNKKIPTQIGTASNWKSISTGSYHSAAIKSDGSLWVWGFNGYGQLGIGIYSSDITIPTQIGTSTNWRSISLGDRHSLALKKDSTLWAWGGNWWGQLGDGTTVDSFIPIQIGTDTNWQSITAKEFHSLAIKSDGTIWAWGGNNVGQLGDGTNNEQHIPIQIGIGTNWKSLAANGFRHSLSINSDGDLWAWGWNNHGQLGDNTFIDKNIPTLLNCPTIGIDEIGQEKGTFNIYPNPATNKITISTNNHLPAETSIIILNMNREQQMNDQFRNQNDIEMDVSTLAKGVYLVKIQTRESVESKKLVIQ